jgi:predicted DNA-binding transcriptional regulator AlpA
MLPKDDAALVLGIETQTFDRNVQRGLLPAPYYVTPRSPRWRLSELWAAIEARRGPAAKIADPEP